MNIILVTIDTLRYDYISSNERRKLYLPIIEDISSESLVYKYAFTSGTSTPFAFPGIFSSVYSHQYQGALGISKVPYSLPEYLKQKDYYTLCLNGGNLYISSAYGYGKIFQNLERDIKKRPVRESNILFKKTKAALKKIGFHKLYKLKNNFSGIMKYILSNEILIETAQDQIKALFRKLDELKPSNFFCAINFMEFHGPYLGLFKTSFYEKYKMWKTFTKRNVLKDPKYLTLIKYYHRESLKLINSALSKLVNRLDMKNLLQDTLLIITSDHGDEYLEHGDYDHKPKPYDEITRVPLIIYKRSESFSQSKNAEQKLVSLVDIAPSITKMLFKEVPTSFMGEPTLLGGGKERDYILVEGYIKKNDPHKRHDPKRQGIRNWAIRTKDWKYMSLNRKEFVFNLLKDPAEKQPLPSNKYKDEVSGFLKELKRKELRNKIHLNKKF